MEGVTDSLEVAAGEDDDFLWMGGQPEGDALHRLLERRDISGEERLQEGPGREAWGEFQIPSLTLNLKKIINK